MKDIIICPSTIPMGKISSPKKDKVLTKKAKETKATSKNSIKGKIPKISIKKTKGKSKEGKAKSAVKKKTPSKKKNENKAESKKKATKEGKSERKTQKNSSLEVGKKRKLSQKNHVIKSNGDNAPPLKIQKIISTNYDASKLVNGNSNTVPDKTWLLKLDLPQRQNAISNGVSNNGPLNICSKSVIFIPKKSNVPGTVVKKTSVKKDQTSNNDKITGMSKLSAFKSLISSSKDSSKKDSYPDLLQDLEKPKNASRIVISKEQKINPNKESKTTYVPNEQKFNSSKEQKMGHSVTGDNKVLLKEQHHVNIKNQKPASKEIKQINAKLEKTSNNKAEIGSSSKDIKSNKIQKTGKGETKNSGKKSGSKEEKALCIREPTKSHPQRMASLDALAKMHVICSTDRRVSSDISKASEKNKEFSEPIIQQKSITESKSIRIGIEKQTQEFGKHIIHSRINCVKVEASSVSERRDIRTFSISQNEQQSVIKRPRGRPRLKPLSESPEPEQPFFKPTTIKQINTKTLLKDFKSKKIFKVDGRRTKHQAECISEKDCKKTKKKKDETKVNQKLCKLENTKSKVKVKETIRMRKTCTYQSVTTVSSHEAVNSVVESCSRLGVTTNYETKETVVTDKACEKKTDLRLEDVHQVPFIPTGDDHCSLRSLSNCCRNIMHPLQQSVIPLAHSQSCHGLQEPRNLNPQQHHCDFNMIQCGHKQHMLHQRNLHECSCCCSGSLLQSMHDTCILAKEANSCVHHSHCQLSPSSLSFCSRCHIPTNESRQHDLHYNWSQTPNCQNRCCKYYDTCHEPRYHQQSSCTQYPVASTKPTAPSVPCDQSPLDLSLGAGTSQSISNSNEQSRTSCPSGHCCQSIKCFQPPPHHNCQHQQQHCNQHIGYVANNCSCRHSSDFTENNKSQVVQMSRPRNNMHCGMLHITPKQTPEHVSFLNSMSSLTVGDGSHADTVHELSTTHNSAFSSTKHERNISIHNRLQLSKKRKFAHGWSWEGDPVEKLIALTNDSVPTPKKCFPAMRHKEGDVIKERDCVLLKSGPKETDLPYVAKVAAFWENQDDGEMMMSLLWYYRPEHTEQGRKIGQMDDEVYASKHRDVNSVACIEDKCYVLTFNEFCRYRTNLAMIDVTSISKACQAVPESTEKYPRQIRLPTEYVSPEMIFFCRHVYDFRQKRILKNPN